MKQQIRKFLGEKQYNALGRFKNRTLADFGYRLGQSPFLLLGLVVKLLPSNSKVTVKSGINVIKKMDYKHRDIYLNIDSDLEYRVRLNSCEKEPDTVEWIETFMKDGEVLYDVGANVGAYSLLASKFSEGKVQVMAFEPSFLNYSQLCKNLVTNHCERSILPFNIALSDQTGIADFNLRVLVPGSAVHSLGEAISSEGEVFKPVAILPVIRYRLDDFIDQFELPAPNHIKIDVDGTEYDILKGMDKTLDGPSVRTMMLEITDASGQADQMLEYLSSKGLKLISTTGLNHLFVRKS